MVGGGVLGHPAVAGGWGPAGRVGRRVPRAQDGAEEVVAVPGALRGYGRPSPQGAHRRGVPAGAPNPHAVGRPHKLPQLALRAHPVLVPGARGRPQLHAAEDPVLAVEEEVQQVEAVEATHSGGHGCEEAGSGSQPRPHGCPPPATRLYGTPRLTGRAREERGARGPVWDHEEVYAHSECETPKSCVFFPKEICADPKGIPTAPPAAPAPPCPRAEEQDEAPELSTPQLPCPAPSGPGEIGLIIWGSEGRRGGGPKGGGGEDDSASFCPCHNTSRP